jgi:hypothetical protein
MMTLWAEVFVYMDEKFLRARMIAYACGIAVFAAVVAWRFLVR